MNKDDFLDTYSKKFPEIVKLIKAEEYKVADLVLKMELVHSQWEQGERLAEIDGTIGEIFEELKIHRIGE